MSRIFSIYRNKLVIYNRKGFSQNTLLDLIKKQLGIKNIIEDSTTSKVYLNKKGELIVKSIEYKLDTDLGTPLYTFGLLSDTHIDGDGDDYGNSISDLNNAIQFFENEGCEFIAYCGDMSYDGRSKDFTALKSCLDVATIPQYTIRGNHDAYATDNGYLEATGKTEEDYTIVRGNDLFIFMSMGNNDETTSWGLTSSKITWLTNLLQANTDKRVFLFYHIPIRGTCGDGGGGLYPWGMIGDSSTTLGNNYINLVKAYPNLIVINGHSHFKFSLQDSYTNANYYHNNGECYFVHVPSCARPRIENPSASDGIDDYTEGSEGFLVEVYENKVLFKPRDFIGNKYLLEYVYIIEL